MRKTIDPTKFLVRFSRVEGRHQCSLCASQITTGVLAQLVYPGLRTPDDGRYMILCDDCAEAMGEMAWDGEGVIDRPVGGNVCGTGAGV
jgi:hypothetical protein